MPADQEPEGSSRTGALLPAQWTADATVIAATLRALREDTAPIWPASDSTVLHVPTEWSTPPAESAPPAGQRTVPDQPITLPRRRARTEPRPDADGSGPTEPTAALPTAVQPTPPIPPIPSTEPTEVPPALTPAPSAEPTEVPAALTAALSTAALLAPPTVAPAAPTGDTRRSRREAAAVQDQRMPESAPRRRAGLFTRLLTVRTFRAHQAQPKVSKSHAEVRALLTAATSRGVLSLHNRRVPGRRGRIEHIAIGAAGIYVVDVWHFKNASIEVRPASEADAGTDELVVGGRVMTAAVRALAQRVEVLRLILVAAGLSDVPVSGALCFVDGLLPLSVADLHVDGMHVLRPNGLTALVAGSGVYGPPDRETLHEFLAERLPASA
jgi:hypothetical protein